MVVVSVSMVRGISRYERSANDGVMMFISEGGRGRE